VHAHEGILAI